MEETENNDLFLGLEDKLCEDPDQVGRPNL